MYLSRVLLDAKRRSTMAAMAKPNVFHGAIESSFQPYSQERLLWRVDELRGQHYLLLLSRSEPDLSDPVRQFGREGESVCETKSYEPLLQKIALGDVWHFRLAANPTRSTKDLPGSQDRGTVVAHVTRQQQREWLLARAERYGFAVNPGDFDVVRSEWKEFRKNERQRHPVSFKMAIYEGMLTVVDQELFKAALVNGIGRSKAYGCGLLTIAPLQVR